MGNKQDTIALDTTRLGLNEKNNCQNTKGQKRQMETPTERSMEIKTIQNIDRTYKPASLGFLLQQIERKNLSGDKEV